MKDKLLSFVVLPSIMFALFLAFSPVGRVEATETNCNSLNKQIDICHSTGSVTNPYVTNHPDTSADLNGHNGHPEDIIPSFDYYVIGVVGTHEECPASYSLFFDWGQFKWRCEKNGPTWDLIDSTTVNEYGCVKDGHYPGKNYDAEGKTILENNCVVPDCLRTTNTYSAWSNWALDEENDREYRTRSVYIVDMQDNSISCGATTIETEYRDIPECEYTTSSSGGWSEWSLNPENNMQEVRERTITETDIYNDLGICSAEKEYEYQTTPSCKYTTTNEGAWSEWEIDNENTTQYVRERTVTVDDNVYDAQCSLEVQKETRPVDSCTLTFEGPIVWGLWTVDPSDSSKEYREGEITVYDKNDSSIICDSYPVTPERRDTPDDPDVLGEDDETGVVLAATGPTDNIAVYVVELLLVAMLVTYSVFFTKTYLKNSK